MHYKSRDELDGNIEHIYNLSLSDEEYELSMVTNNFLFEFKLQQKNEIVNYCYNSKFYLEKINMLLNTTFTRIKEVFDFFDQILKDKRVELIKSREKSIINLKFKNADNLNTKKDIILELNQIHENLFNDFQFTNFKFGNSNKNTEKQIFDALNTYASIYRNQNQNVEKSRDESDLSSYITQLYQTLNANLGDTEIFKEIIMCIFVYELKKTKNDNYKLTLTDIIINNNGLIVCSYPFMDILFEFISSIPTYIGENLRKIQESQIPWLELINNSNNEILNQILLRIFENKINIYFEAIPNVTNADDQNKYFKKYFDYKNNNNNEINPTFILSDKSLELFKDCINVIVNIYNDRKEGKKIIKNELLCQIYSIAYIKIYLFKFVFFSHHNNIQFNDFEEILKAINGEEKNEVREMIKIYIFKVFFYILGNYHDFYNYDFVNHKINFFDEIKQRLEEKKDILFNYFMLPNGEQNKLNLFNEYIDKFKSAICDDLNTQLNSFVNLIADNGIDLFFIISCDLIFSNLALHNYVDKPNYLRYSSFVNNIFADPKLKLLEVTKNLFFLFSNKEIFENTMKKKLLDEQNQKEINTDKLECLLYALRFCLQTTNQEKPNEYLYSKIISQDCENCLKSNCLPGNNSSDNNYIQNYFSIEDHLNKLPSNVGAYVCGCGTYYSINPCGFPDKNSKANCTTCGNKIGYDELPPGIKGSHGFAHVPGHYRIFKDQA